jgi:hypothetical protein
VDLELRTFYGQLQHIIVVCLAKSRSLGIKQSETIILTAIQVCVEPTAALNGLDLHGLLFKQLIKYILTGASFFCLLR